MSKQALIVVDVQEALIGGKVIPPVFEARDLVKKINSLIDKARKKDLPVIFIKHNGPEKHILAKGAEGNRIAGELNRLKDDTVIEKMVSDAFFGTNLEQELRSPGIEELIICGIQTEICIDTICRSAFSRNFKVVLVSDAHSTWSKQDLEAPQIIKHHNEIIGEWFGTLKKENEVLL